jgi:hemerythrin-like domain-containing protein
VIEQAMRALEGICLRICASGIVPDEELTKLLDFIQDYADGFHHAKEEKLFFPALEEAGIPSSLVYLCHEHELERRLLGELRSALEEYRNDPADYANFVSAALLFRDHLLGHMEQEDSLLFRLAEEVLDDRSKDALNLALTGENERCESLIRRYERLAAELDRAWAV